MIVLGIETATAFCAAALTNDGLVLGEQSLQAPQVHSERLLPMIDELLRGHGIPPAEIGAIAVSIGPGSYTGLRIGLSVAKGLAFAHDIPIVAVPTLRGIALHASEHAAAAGRAVVALLESRKDEVFLAAFTMKSGLPVETLPAQALGSADAASLVRALGPAFLAGPGAARVGPLLRPEISGGDVVQLPPDVVPCSAAAIARLGAQILMGSGPADAAALEPFYLKEFFTTAKPVQPTE